MKGILTGIGVGLLAALLLKLIGMKTIISITIGLFAGAIIAIVMIARSRGERPKDVAREVVQQVVNPDPNVLKHRVEEQLIRLNEKLRLKSAPQPVIIAGEEVIDLLLEVVPRALEESPRSEATFDLEKLSTDYLSALFGNYLELSSDDKISHQEDLLNQLRELAETIHAAKASLDAGNLDEFQVSSAFLKAKTA